MYYTCNASLVFADEPQQPQTTYACTAINEAALRLPLLIIDNKAFKSIAIYIYFTLNLHVHTNVYSTKMETCLRYRHANVTRMFNVADRYSTNSFMILVIIGWLYVPA